MKIRYVLYHDIDHKYKYIYSFDGDTFTSLITGRNWNKTFKLSEFSTSLQTLEEYINFFNFGEDIIKEITWQEVENIKVELL